MSKLGFSIVIIVVLVMTTTMAVFGQQLQALAPANLVYLPIVQVGSTGSQCLSPGEGWVRESLEGSCGWHLSEGLFVLLGGNSAVVLQLVADENARGPFDGNKVYQAPATIWIEDPTAPAVIAVTVWIDPMPTPFPCVSPGEGWTPDPLQGSCGWHLETGVKVVLSGGDIFSWIDAGAAAISGPFENEEFTGPVTLWYEPEATRLVTSTLVPVTPTPVVSCEELRPSSGWTRDLLQGSCGWHLETGSMVSLTGGNNTVLLVKSATVSVRGPFSSTEVAGPATLWYESLEAPRVVSTALLGPPVEPTRTPTATPTTPSSTATPTSQPTAIPPTATATVVPTEVPCQVPQGTPGEWDRIVDVNQQPMGCGWQLRIDTSVLTINVPQSWKIVTESGEVIGPVTVQIPAFQGASLWRLP